MLTTLEAYKDKKVTSLHVMAQVEPALMGLGIVPTGTVIFELVQKNKMPKVLVKTSLKGGKATLDVGRPSSVFNQLIEVVYEGNSDCSTNETIRMIKPTHVGSTTDRGRRVGAREFSGRLARGAGPAGR